MSPRILVVYYSRTGHTRQIAEQLAAALDAELEAITEARTRAGLLGYVRSVYQAVRARRPVIGPTAHDPAGYDLVVVGTPIWAKAMASPVRSYLGRHHAVLRQVAWFCTSGGDVTAPAFAQMTAVSGREPLATLGIRAGELDQAGAAIEGFVAELRAAAPLPPPVRGPTLVPPPPPGPAAP